MLTIDRLIVEDFGPYRGRQEIVFERERGVYIIYGPNGRGKTSLHNAFRYALYGNIRDRMGAEEPAALVNIEARREAGGVGSFETVLDFHHKNVPYRLLRRYDESVSGLETVILERDRHVYSSEESKRIMQMIAPEQVSQFFLFDGELLRQYEDLLDERSSDGKELEKSIERVLGVPILKNAKSDAEEVSRVASRQLIDHYASEEKSKRLGIALQNAEAVKNRLREDLRDVEQQVEAGNARIAEIEAILREQDKAKNLVGQITQLRSQVARATEREKQAVAALDEISPDLWKFVLATSASKRLADIDASMEETQERIGRAAAITRDLNHFHSQEDCPVCHRPLPASLRSELIQELTSISQAGTDESHHRLQRLRAMRRTLQELSRHDPRTVIERDKARRDLILERESLQEDLRELEQELADIGQREDHLRALSNELEERKRKLVRDGDRVTDLNADVIEKERIIDDMKRKVRQQVAPDPAVELKDQIAQQLAQLFGDSIEAYRNKLRRRVESHASEVFRVLASEPDYDRLEITDRYGLKIIDSDGDEVRRSAGYEHLVALSLIAALQDSAAVRGPVIMDYPFGRLDSENTARVVAALPRMARQVVLLSFDGEFDRDVAMSALRGSLVAEYELERRSTKHTVISPRRSSDE
ncbi:AAA family ATPase [Streptomyces griseoincarnatus]